MLIWAYSRGVFPMAETRAGDIGWYCPDPRAILPLDTFHVSRSLRRSVKQGQFHITTDTVFERVILACAEPRSEHPETWINQQIIDAYITLYNIGRAHSVEAWDNKTRWQLLGGLYGVTLGGAFFGESMFSREPDASKVCLVHLVEHLCRQGFTLLDTQFSSPHLKQFGVIEIPREEYSLKLQEALRLQVDW